jgi:hypothetical protein
VNVKLAALVVLLLAGCGPSYTADDQTAASIGTRNAATLLTECASDDAGTSCSPSLVRARARIIFCASQHALTVHGTPYDGGVPCQATP